VEIVFGVDAGGGAAEQTRALRPRGVRWRLVASQASRKVHLRELLAHLPVALKAVERSLRE
jgi:hypothetical protein